LVRAYGSLPAPLAAEFPAYVIIECTGRTDPTDELVELLASVPEVGDAAVAADAAGRARLWAYRETHTEAISAAGVPVKLDVCVPLDRLSTVVASLADVVPT